MDSSNNKFIVPINKTMLDYCLTIPKKYHEQLNLQSLIHNNHKDIEIIWDDRSFKGIIYGKHKSDDMLSYKAYQLHFERDLLDIISETFIQSYMVIQSQIYEKDTNKQYKTVLPENCKEYLEVTILNYDTLQFKTSKQVKTPYDNIFKNLLYENVFGWMGKSSEEYNKMITYSSKWLDLEELNKYIDTPHVIYYLIDEDKKELYIGSATHLGDRVKPCRKEIPGWNKFRYEKVHEDYYKDMKNIEYHSIINFSKFFRNNGNKSTLNLSDYNLINKDYGYYKNK